MIQIELPFFDGCPSWQTASEDLQRVIEAKNISAEMCLVNIESPELCVGMFIRNYYRTITNHRTQLTSNQGRSGI